MNIRRVDITKKSNIKCEHCEHWSSYKIGCNNPKSEKYNTSTAYYNRCKSFQWKNTIMKDYL